MTCDRLAGCRRLGILGMHAPIDLHHTALGVPVVLSCLLFATRAYKHSGDCAMGKLDAHREHVCERVTDLRIRLRIRPRCTAAPLAAPCAALIGSVRRCSAYRADHAAKRPVLVGVGRRGSLVVAASVARVRLCRVSEKRALLRA